MTGISEIKNIHYLMKKLIAKFSEIPQAMFHIDQIGNLPVYIKLVLLVVKEKTTTCFEYWKMTGIGVHQ